MYARARVRQKIKKKILHYYIPYIYKYFQFASEKTVSR